MVFDTTLPLTDVVLRATVTGAGPTVLLLHAGRERRHVWGPVAGRLAAHGLRTVAYDLRGHGESTGEATTMRAVGGDVAEIVARQPTPLVVAGASLGGLAALTALADPAVARRVAGLVLVDVVPDPDPARGRSWLDAHGLLDQHTLRLVDDIDATGAKRLAVAASLEMPVLLVRGEDSPVADADVDRLRAVNPRVAVTSVADAGHLVARDAPDALADVLVAHTTRWLRPVGTVT